MPKPGSSEWYTKLAELEAAEVQQLMGWWYLSFVDPDLPAGTRWLGAVIVIARGILGATDIASFLGINPGGEVKAKRLSNDTKDLKLPQGTKMTDIAYKLLTMADFEKYMGGSVKWK